MLIVRLFSDSIIPDVSEVLIFRHFNSGVFQMCFIVRSFSDD